MPSLILKTQPGRTWDDLMRRGRMTWDCSSLKGDLNNLRDSRAGDDAFLFDSRSGAIVGMARITSDPYEHEDHPGVRGDGLPQRPVIDMEPVEPVSTPLTLDAMRADTRFRDAVPQLDGPPLVIAPTEEIDLYIRHACKLRKPYGRWRPPARAVI